MRARTPELLLNLGLAIDGSILVRPNAAIQSYLEFVFTVTVYCLRNGILHLNTGYF